MWCSDLMEYYNVTEEECIELGRRQTGRKPMFPSSVSCPNPPQGLCFEEIFDSKIRTTIQQKLDFYKDLGPWQVFRQTVYRMNYDYGRYFKYFNFDGEKLVICEYGCGISHLVNFIIDRMGDVGEKFNIKFILIDCAGEHLEYAKWRLKKKAPNTEFEFHEITESYPVPLFTDLIDFTLIADTLEHLFNPFDVIKNIRENSNPSSILIETWIDHKDFGYSDLEEAVIQRPKTIEYMDTNYSVIENLDGGDTRVRKLK